jgi:hypothetical protein
LLSDSEKQIYVDVDMLVKVEEIITFVGKNRYNDKKVGISTTKNGSLTYKSGKHNHF